MTYITTAEAAVILGVKHGSMFRLKGIENVRHTYQRVGHTRCKMYHADDIDKLKAWRNSEEFQAEHIAKKRSGGKAKRINRKPRPRKQAREHAQAVTRTASNGEKYTFIPAPFEVPVAWEWSA
ncbi:hypothetical protein KC887_07855 [Candidatus Kaiserbacteria bacterium]|nr:hypothetical protein [Candidatus Kaiserbacteria bacterium]